MTKKDNIYIYDNVGEFVEWLNKTKQTKKGREYSGSTRTGEEQEQFTGTASYEAAQELLDKGDPTLSRMIMEQCMEIKAKSKSGYMRSNGIVNGPQGFVPNIGAYMTGHPNNMVNMQRTFKPMSKVLTLVYQINVGYSTTTNQMISAATKVACAITTLEAKGYRLNVYVGTKRYNPQSRGQNNEVSCIVKIKDAGKPLDPLRIAYPLAHPSMPRRHMFAFAERAKFTLPAHYGCITELRAGTLKQHIGDCVVLRAENIINGNNTFEAIAKQIEGQSNVRR